MAEFEFKCNTCKFYKVGSRCECCFDCGRYEEDKYRWHDLRKNPNDLPTPWEYVLITTYKNKVYVARTDNVLHTWVLRDDEFAYCDIGSSMVKAWREIEPFEEVEE